MNWIDKLLFNFVLEDLMIEWDEIASRCRLLWRMMRFQMWCGETVDLKEFEGLESQINTGE